MNVTLGWQPQAWNRQTSFSPGHAMMLQQMQMMMKAVLMMGSSEIPMMMNQSLSPFGAGSPAGTLGPGVGNFLGQAGSGSAGGFIQGSPSPYNGSWSGSLTSAGESPVPLGQVGQSNSGAANTLMESIRRNPVPPRCRPGYCYRGVKHHLRQIGVNLTGGSAYQAADQLARNDRFREVQVSREELRSLPAGAVVVWDRNASRGKRHGHISIAMGDGREASDKIRNQISNYPSTFRVFIPR